jgi:hypothetical protein
LRLAAAASSSPAQINTEVVEDCRKSSLGGAVVIEIVVWLAVLQMLSPPFRFLSRLIVAFLEGRILYVVDTSLALPPRARCGTHAAQWSP